MQVFLVLAYVVVGFIQLFAIIDGTSYALGIGSLLSGVIAIFTTWIPLIVSLLGVYGAVQVWDWSIFQALLLFFWYIPAGLIITLGSAALAFASQRSR